MFGMLEQSIPNLLTLLCTRAILLFSTECKRLNLRRVLPRILLLALAIVCLFCVYAFYQLLPHTAPSKVLYHSQHPYKAVQIPFRLQNNLISLSADFAGRKTNCILDTGSPAVLWPHRMNLLGHKTLVAGYGTDAAGSSSRFSEYILSSIEIGNYELQGIPTLALDNVAV